MSSDDELDLESIDDLDDTVINQSDLITSSSLLYVDDTEDEITLDDSLDLEDIEDNEIAINLLEGDVNTADDTKAIVAKKRKEAKLLASSTKALMSSSSDVYDKLSVSLISYKSVEDYQREDERINNELTRNVPSFLNEGQVSTIKKQIDLIDLDNTEQVIAMYYNICANRTKTPYEFHVFCDYLRSLKNTVAGDSIVTRNQFDRKMSEVVSAISDLFDEQQPAIYTNLSELRNNPDIVHLLKHGVLSKNGFRFTCANCNEEVDYSGRIVSVFPDGPYYVVVTPLKCPQCGHYSILAEDGSKRLIKKLMKEKRLENIDYVEENISLAKAKLYYPSFADIAEAYAPVVTIDEVKDDNDSSYNLEVSWETLVKDWKVLHKTLASRILSSHSKVGYHNLAKVLANQSNSYKNLKERALATLIKVIDSNSWLTLDADTQNRMKIAASYAPRIKNFKQAFCTYQGYSEIYFDDEYGKLCKDVSALNYINDMRMKELTECKYILANLPIQDIALTKDMIANYLSNPELEKILFEISDLMVIANVSESYFEFYKPRKMSRGGTVVGDLSYIQLISKLRDVSHTSEISKNLYKLLSKFNDIFGYLGLKLKMSNFTISCIDSYQILADIARIAKLLYSGDIYDGIILYNKFIVLHSDVINSFSHIPIFEPIYKAFSNIPSIPEGMSKVDWYFPEFRDCTVEEKAMLLSVYESRKFRPKTFLGNTFEEKLNYYKSLSDSFSDYYVREEVSAYRNKYAVYLMSIMYFDHNCVFNDWMTYLLGKDLFLSFSQISLENLSEILYINDNAVHLFLEDDFEFKKYNINYAKYLKDLVFSTAIYNDILHSIDFTKSNLESDLPILKKDLEGFDLPTRVLEAAYN